MTGPAEPEQRWRQTKAALALMQYASTAKRPLTLSVLLALTAAVVDLGLLYVVYRAVDELIVGTASDADLVRYAGLAAGAVVAGQALFMTATAISHVAAFEILFGLLMRMADRLARLPLGYFARRRSGELKQVIVDDVERLEIYIAHGIPEMIAGFGVWLVASVWLFVVDWRIALAATALAPVAFVLMHRAMRASERTTPAGQEPESAMNGPIVEYVGGMPVIKVFNRAGDAFGATRATVTERTRAWMRWSNAFIPLGSPFYSLVVANIVTTVPVGVWLYATERVTLSTLLLFVILGVGYNTALLRCFTQATGLAYVASSGRLVELILSEPELSDSGRSAELADHSVEFRDVCFAYEERQVLDRVSFTAAQGKVTALVGPSGAGKTTIARLIARFWGRRRALAALTRDKTLLVVARRLSTIRGADQIVVLDAGRVVQRGTHDELVTQPGLYARFVGQREKASGWRLARATAGVDR